MPGHFTKDTMIKDIIQNNETISPNTQVRNVLRTHFPQCFNKEGHFDLDKFKEQVKNDVDITHEGYDLNFLGKNYAKLLASLDTTTVVQPDLEHNAQPENANSQNLYISGDNLDGLKHLLKSYTGAVKCIYIDPPYNTGSDGFVYNDKFNFSTQDLIQKLSINDEQVQKILDLTSKGRASHSAWLTFMYPRLLLSRDLLTNDGVIFISIDDNEQSNLKLLCDSVFGEENMLCSFIWKKRQMVDSRTKNGASKDHDYLICYGNSETARILGKDSDKTKYSNPDNDPNGDWMSADMTGLATESQRPNLHYELLDPKTGIVYACPPTGWRYEPTRMQDLISNGEVIFPKELFGRPRRKKYLKDVESEYTGLSSILSTVYSTQGTRELRELFEGNDFFDFPKPVDLIKQIIKQGTSPTLKDNIFILDFFGGSSTTAHACMELMNEMQNLHFILIQWKESFNSNSDAFKAGYSTIDQLGIERIKRAAKKIKAETNASIDYGFKHYTLLEPSEDTIDKLEDFKPDEMFVNNDTLSMFGKETVLETWLVKDGYGFGATAQEIKLHTYTAYLHDKHLYFIESGLTENDMVALLDKYQQEPTFNPENIVVFGYSFNFSQTEMLRKNLFVLRDSHKNLKANFDIRY
jgi:adenine specific DNA methylase Mod